jgi:leucyl/phenylalanyl-tRNA--protein transferase
MHPAPPLAWLEPGQSLPPPDRAWGRESPAPGLLAAGHELSSERVIEAYRQGCFPWFSQGQPVLWWSPDPRMVLPPERFRCRRSLIQSLRQWTAKPGFELVFDRDFSQVIEQCARLPRRGQQGTWIVPAMVEVYCHLHHQGLAHSAEAWYQGKLVGGLYFISLGRMVFGESMFTLISNGSKMALALLVSVARHHGVALIDCQQNTAHLSSLGAYEIPRNEFLQTVRKAQQGPAIEWQQETLYWNELERPSK